MSFKEIKTLLDLSKQLNVKIPEIHLNKEQMMDLILPQGIRDLNEDVQLNFEGTKIIYKKIEGDLK